MRIARFNLHRFALSLARPLPLRDSRPTRRAGLVVELTDERGHCGLGEASPLPGLSGEDLTMVESQLRSLRDALLKTEAPDNLEELSGGFTRWLEPFDLSPSARFGFETAILNLIADNRRLPLRRLISDTAGDSVVINGLLNGSADEILEKAVRLRDEGYKAVKLKVGAGQLHEDILLTREVRRCIGPEIALRLDANRSWSLDEALFFAREVSDCGIDYVEEPVTDYDALKTMMGKMGVPVAMDESLQEIAPEFLMPLPNLKAIVLKPTLLGLERSMQFSRRAVPFGIVPVVSSSFESGLGLTALAEFAASMDMGDLPVGLGTLDQFAQDLLTPGIRIDRGRIDLSKSVPRPDHLRRELLEAVADD